MTSATYYAGLSNEELTALMSEWANRTSPAAAAVKTEIWQEWLKRQQNAG